MNAKQVRDSLFYSHRIIGLIVGLALVIIGLTGSILVFQREINEAQIAAQFGRVIPQGNVLSPDQILNTVNVAYSDRPELKPVAILRKPVADAPYRVSLKSSDDQTTAVFVNPYTGVIMGSFINEQTWVYLTFKLHYALLAGDNGQIVVGVIAGLLFVLCVTGIALWSGWRKLITGFKIKWNAHPKRTSYDLHKVAGIITAVFLAFTAVTGFVWNFHDFTYPLIYAVTGTPNLPTPESTAIANQSTLSLAEILPKADAALPGATTTLINLPQKPEGVYRVRKKFPQESWHFGRSFVFLDQYTGKVLQVKDGANPKLGDRILNTFTPLHYGTFGGLPSRILYVFVGLAPLILFITGFVMWWHRKRKKPVTPATQKLETRSLP